MVRQHIVEITCDGNLIVSDDVDDFLNAVVILVSDIHLSSVTCRYGSAADEGLLVIGLDDLTPPFRFFLCRFWFVSCDITISLSSPESSCSVSIGVLLASGGMVMSSRLNALMMKLLSISEAFVFRAMMVKFTNG